MEQRTETEAQLRNFFRCAPLNLAKVAREIFISKKVLYDFMGKTYTTKLGVTKPCGLGKHYRKVLEYAQKSGFQA